MATYEIFSKPEPEDEVTLILRMTKAEFKDLVSTGQEESALGNLDAFDALHDRLGMTRKRIQ